MWSRHKIMNLTNSFNHNQKILLGREVKYLNYDFEPILINSSFATLVHEDIEKEFNAKLSIHQ
jgi:hypothetical protein